MGKSTRFVGGLALAVAGCFLVYGARAEEEAPASVAQLATDEQQLDKAAAALDQIATLKHDYLDKMSVASPADRDQLAGEAQRAFTRAVTDHGLSLAEYAQVMDAAKTDPQLREKVYQRIHRLRTGKSRM
jgi:hypothetical protein